MATRHRTHESEQRAGAGPKRQGGRKRPDGVTRLMHAVLAAAFLGAWLTASLDGLRAWHIAFGYAAAGALLSRVAWSLRRPQTSLVHWWRTLVRAGRRLHSGRVGAAGYAGSLRPATWSVMGLAGVVCGMVLLVPACFVTGWTLDRLVEAPPGPVDLHRWLGTALMVAVATHVALIAVLGVLRGRCMACDMLSGRGDRSGDSGDARD